VFRGLRPLLAAAVIAFPGLDLEKEVIKPYSARTQLDQLKMHLLARMTANVVIKRH
jgi:hypothetical protein